MIVTVVHFILSAQTLDGQNSLDCGRKLVLCHPEHLETDSFKTVSLHLEMVCMVVEQYVCVVFAQWFSLKSW